MDKYLIVSVLLVMLIAPGMALSWGDNFQSTSLDSYYNHTASPDWTITGGYLDASSVNLSIRYTLQFNTYSYGNYTVSTYTPSTGTGRYSGLFFGRATNESVGDVRTTGNGYSVFLRTSTSQLNTSYIYRTVAGSSSLLATTYIPFNSPVVFVQNWNNQTTIWQNSNITHFVNGGRAANTTDVTFSSGYSGLAKINSLISPNRFDNFYINETITSNFTCTATGCNQSGQNYNDPGVNTRWMFSDGTQSTEKNVTKAFGSGVWTVALNNMNVAGSASEMKPDYITVASPPSWGLVINPSVESCRWWDILCKITEV
jgi:hypothetical protein